MARQNISAPPPIPNGQPKDSLYNVSNAQNNPAQQSAAMNQSIPFPPIPPPVNVPAAPATFAQHSQGSNNGAQNLASNQTNPFAAVPPMVPPNALSPAVQQQLLIAKALSDQGIPHDKIVGIIAAMGSQGPPPMMGAGGIPPPPPQFAAQNQNANAQNGWASRPEESRDHSSYHEAVRSPQSRYNRRRSRSPSPARGWNSRDSPPSRRRDEPMNDYDRDSPGRNRGGDDRGRGRGRGNEYRQRSPPRRQSSTPPRTGGNKWVGYDDSIGKGNIKGIFQKPYPFCKF
jgi:protein NRD1